MSIDLGLHNTVDRIEAIVKDNAEWHKNHAKWLKANQDGLESISDAQVTIAELINKNTQTVIDVIKKNNQLLQAQTPEGVQQLIRENEYLRKQLEAYKRKEAARNSYQPSR